MLNENITRWRSLMDPNGRREAITWAALAAEFRETWQPFAGPDHPGWSAAVFRGDKRGRAYVEHVTALVLDYDGTATEDEVLAPWGNAAGFLHTTKSHAKDNPSFRILLQLSRPVSAFEYDALWARVNAHCGGKLDRQARDPSRFWFMPSRTDGDGFRVRELSGEALDPDEWLTRPDPESRVAAPRVDNSDLDRTDHRIKRALAYVSRVDGAIAGSQGHKATWAVACVLVKGFSLGQRDALNILANDYNPRCVPPWSTKELEHKIKQASKANLADGYLLGDETPRRVGASVIRDPEIPPEPADDADRQPGDDTEEIAKEIAASPAPEPAKPDTLKQYGVVTLHAMYQAVIDEALRGASAKGFPIGLKDIDDAIGGLRVGNVTLLAAMTSWGKSSFGIMAMANNLGGDARPLIVSVEDKLLLYSKRVTARTCKINALALRDNDLHKADYDKIYKTMMELPNEPVFIDAVGKSVEWVAEAISACCKHLGTKLVICDYVQRFKTNKHAGDKKNQVTYIGETLSDAIKNGGAAGLVLSQVKRTQGKEPTMDDVKESGDLENMAEHVMIGWRLEEKGGSSFGQAAVARRLNIPKNKDGPIVTKWIDLTFDETTASFVTPADVRMRDREQRGYGDYDGIADN